MKKEYTGSCHCGAVRYQAMIDLSAGTNKCNCSICTKTRNWSVVVKSEDFRLLLGEGDLSDYLSGDRSVHHLFCRHCGVRPFARGNLKELGGDYVAIQLSTLDDALPADLVQAPVRYANGRDNDWWTVPEETRHL